MNHSIYLLTHASKKAKHLIGYLVFSFILIGLLCPTVQAQAVINAQNYGATGNDSSDDTIAIRAALKAASDLSIASGNAPVKVLLPTGRYHISSKDGIVLPSNIIFSGDPNGESVILNKPRDGGLFGVVTRDVNIDYSYMIVARADDLQSHPAVPNNSYRGLNYIYLKDPNDIRILQSLGVPSTPSSSRVVPCEVASGGTLSNNSNYPGTGPGTPPKVQMEADGQMNPTPANFNGILAVDSTGKVTLSEPNRLNWGVDAQATPNQSLTDYYSPSGSYSMSRMISGPAWLIPANNYHHDITIEYLYFETDPSESDRLRYACDLYVGYCYNVAVKNCNFRKTPGFYHLEAIRCFNTLIANNDFTLYSLQSVALDAGSGFVISDNIFRGTSWPNAASFSIPPTAINYIVFDEEPMDITIADNQFLPLVQTSFSSKAGKAIFGPGGAYLKMVNNRFTGIPGKMIETSFYNDNGIIANNRMFNCTGQLGGSAPGLNAFDNRYDNAANVRGGIAINLYNPRGNPVNYFCSNYGVTFEEWYFPTTYFSSNLNTSGQPINSVNVINLNGVSGSYGTASNSGGLNSLTITSISSSSATLGLGTRASVTVTLSGTTSMAYPFFLIPSGGDRDAVGMKSFVAEIPSGQQSVTLVNELTALRPGQITISAKPLASSSTTSASVNLTVGQTSNQSPNVNLTSPASGSIFTEPATITLNAAASDSDGTIAKVEFFQASTKLGEKTSAPYTLTWNNVSSGSYSLTAKATDNKGATTTSTSVVVSVNSPPNQLPTVNLTNPTAGSTFTAPASITLSANASDSDGTIAKVEFFQGTTKIGESLTAPYNLNWSNVSASSYSLTAKATDNRGATTTSSAVNITVNSNQLPAVTLTSPLNNSNFTAPATVNLNASASDSDGSIVKVEFFQGSTKIGEKIAIPYNITWNNVTAGTYSLTAKATDNLGGTSTSTPITISVSPIQSNGNGIGLKGEYFSDSILGNLKLTRTDAMINFNWVYSSPDPAIPTDRFSIRWTGKIQPRYSETYTFYASCDDGIRVWINGRLLIDSWLYHGASELSRSIALTAGQLYDIKVEYYEGGGGALAKLSWSSTSQVKETVPKTQLYPASSPGTGLKADYYTGQNFSSLKLTRTDASINFDWGTGSPAPSIGSDGFSVRWTGKIQPRYSGTYTFYAFCDDGIRVWINGQLIIDSWFYHGTSELSGSIPLSNDQPYDIKVEYYEGAGNTQVKLSWSSAAQIKEVIPKSQLYPF